MSCQSLARGLLRHWCAHLASVSAFATPTPSARQAASRRVTGAALMLRLSPGWSALHRLCGMCTTIVGYSGRGARTNCEHCWHRIHGPTLCVLHSTEQAYKHRSWPSGADPMPQQCCKDSWGFKQTTLAIPQRSRRPRFTHLTMRQTRSCKQAWAPGERGAPSPDDSGQLGEV
jgi:hypothetical protein